MSNRLPFGKQKFKYFISYKDDQKLDLYAYSFQKLVQQYQKKHYSNIINRKSQQYYQKSINSELVYNKNIYNLETKSTQKNAFIVFIYQEF